jgi:hypothetical protein
MSDKVRCMALCSCGWAESRTARSKKERAIGLVMKELERAAWKHARETGHTVELGDVSGESRRISGDSPEP